MHALSILFTNLFHITPFFLHIVNFLSSISSVHVSNGVNEALSYPKWKEAAIEEMKALEKKQTWGLVELPKEKKVGCKWVNSLKFKPNGEMERCKEKSLAKGYTNLWG